MVNTNTRFADRKRRTMMYNVDDLKSRALVESNILKQFILAANAKDRGEFKPKLDDILIHDYQMANSVTLNVILSNFMVDLSYAVDCMQNPLYGGAKDSYFKLVRRSSNGQTLDDQTRLVLAIDAEDGTGTFESRDLVLKPEKIWNSSEKVTKFIPLDSIWYCKKVVGGHDTIALVDQMNNFDKNPNPFGGNPFDKELFYPNGGSMNVTFNDWLDGDGRKTLNCIVENRFYKNVMSEEGFGKTITSCRYLICVPGGFYGLESHWDSTTGGFKGFILHDIGGALPILDKSFTFKFCSFHVIGKGDETTLFLALVDESGKYHYLYLNESSLDETYGFTEIDSVVVDQLIVPPSDVFSKVEQVRELDTVNIALTDYGFWDLEANTTNNQTYSYRGVKKYDDPIQLGNQDGSKLTTPTVECLGTTKFVEYSDDGDEYAIDRRWNACGENWYLCRGLEVNPYVGSDLDRYKKYRSWIDGTGTTQLPFFGATEHFAVYDSEGDDPVGILVNLTLPQFTKLLYASPQLTNYFIEWLYEQVVQGKRVVSGNTIHNGKGEYYLWNNNGNFIANLESALAPASGNSYTGLELALNTHYPQDFYLELSTKFDSVDSLVTAYDPPAPGTNLTMTDYCNDLYKIVNGSFDSNWLVDEHDGLSGRNRILATMMHLFSKVTWPTEKYHTFVNDTLDKLVNSFQLLVYFKDYLKMHLEHDLEDFDNALRPSTTPSPKFASGEEQRVVDAVKNHVKGKVSASLVLGGYTPPAHGVEPSNSNYPNIDQYLYQNQRRLNKVQVRDVMSITNTLKEVMFAVQSTDFIMECDSFLDMKNRRNENTLFKMTQNEDFAALSKLVQSDGKTLDVDWDTDAPGKPSVKTWMFESNPDNCSDEAMLKAFVRTQIYRPLFFKHDDYVSFTSNESAYSCTTTKWYYDHEGNPPKRIVFQNGTWPDDPKVDKAGSGLLDTATYTIPEIVDEERKINFYNISNKFEYFIYYNPVKIVQDKFVVNDVEFYVVRPIEGSRAVNSIYFNEFQNNTEGQNQVAKVSANKFKLNGIEYVIEGNEISVDPATTSFTDEEKEWKCEIVDDRFCFDGTWYILERDSSNKYAYVKYADNKDNKLIELDVTEDGYAEYKPWGIQFQFNSAWTQVQVVQKHQSDVIDRLETERCEFDSTVITFDEEGNKTYDWYLANEILRIQRVYAPQSQALLNLGNGLMFSGGLKLATNPTKGMECRVQIRNELQNEDVVTICELVKKYGDVEQVQQMGTLFDRDLNLDENRVFRGNLGADNLVSKSDAGTMAFFVKDLGKGLNNVNTAWANYSNWVNSYRIESEDVGTAREDEQTKELQVTWGVSDYADPSNTAVKLTPIHKVDDEGNETTDTIKYLATIGDGSVQYTVWVTGDHVVHFIVNENRYRLNLTTLKLDRLVVNDIQVETVDFSTQYDPTQLRDNLAQNVKTTMLNQMVQAVIDSTRTSSGSIVIGFERPIAQYLDLFTDSASLGNYVSAWELDIDSTQCEKFSQVYKNNLKDVDDSNMSNGNVYGHLAGNISSTFVDEVGNQKSNILVVDSPSIEVRRVD